MKAKDLCKLILSYTRYEQNNKRIKNKSNKEKTMQNNTAINSHDNRIKKRKMIIVELPCKFMWPINRDEQNKWLKIPRESHTFLCTRKVHMKEKKSLKYND